MMTWNLRGWEGLTCIDYNIVLVVSYQPRQCLTLILLLTCTLGNYVSSFTCRVYFFGCPKKSPPLFARCFIEFSILVPSNFMPSINPKREVIRSHWLLAVKSLHKISTLFHCNQHSHAYITFTVHRLL